MNHYFDMSEKIHHLKFKCLSVHERDEDTDIKLVAVLPTIEWDAKMEPIVYAVDSDSEEVRPGHIFDVQLSDEELYKLGYGPPPEWVDLQYRMEDAVESECYEAAAVLRDIINEMKGNDRD